MSTEYKLKTYVSEEEGYADWKEGEDIACCECCNQEVPLHMFQGRGGQGKLVDQAYCELCASTYASTDSQYQQGDYRLMAHVCAVGNLVIKKVEELVNGKRRFPHTLEEVKQIIAYLEKENDGKKI